MTYQNKACILLEAASQYYVDAGYCYRQSDCHEREPCKNGTAEPIKLSFGMWSRVGPKNHMGVQILPREEEILRGEGMAHCKV